MREIANWFCIALTAASLEAQQADALRVSLVGHGDVVNSIPRHVGGPITVEVRDAKDRIVPGARVEFSTPAAGPSGAVSGRHSFLAWTDTEGRAHVNDLVPNEEEGAFPITVEASFMGRQGTATFRENNSPVETAVTRSYIVNRPNHKVRNTLIVAGVVGAAALAIGLSLALSGGAAKAVSPTPTTVAIGGVSVGSPQ